MTEVRRTFHEELAKLREELVEMGLLAESMVEQAVEALRDRDLALAASIVAQDARVDSLDSDIEKRCLWFLASQQPNTRDLRFISASFRMTSDLERIGDHAVDMSKVCRKLAPGTDVDIIIPLADLATEQLKRSLSVLNAYDADVLVKIFEQDPEIDNAFRAMREKLLDDAPVAPAATSLGYIILLVVSLERIAHHAVHIAERIHFVETGKLEVPRRE